MRNYYINRNEKKKITGLYARPQWAGQEFLPETDKKIISYLKKQEETLAKSQSNEQKITAEIRKLAIDNLIAKGDLPVNYA